MFHRVRSHICGTNVVTKNHWGEGKETPNLDNKDISPSSSATECATTRYSASALEREKVACFLEDQKTTDHNITQEQVETSGRTTS
ncbi:hypothetical protein LIER_36443 [Lithospermum erythrorhizon]|uniref:Uncharacterized protein n=1 Tax=Lithospermum erythrorhizon TaxID=34254 RepID=A0AAV3P7A0_LITER